MTFDEAMKALEKAGTEQNRKLYAKHGVRAAMFGVSYATQKDLAKRIKVDDDLATRLWNSGNHDARVLATMVADPAKAGKKLLDSRSKELDNYVLTDALSALAARSPEALSIAKTWIKAKQEWVASAGWNVVASLAMNGQGIGDDIFEGMIPVIEAGIHAAPNRARHAMNNALIAIGIRSAALEAKAVRAATSIGRVEVDHGETGCKTPEAVAYIRKARARKK